MIYPYVKSTVWAGGSDWDISNPTGASLADRHDQSADRSNNYPAADGHAKYLKVSSVSWIAGGTAPTKIPSEKMTSPVSLTFFTGDTQYPN